MRFVFRYSAKHFPIIVRGLFAILCIALCMPFVLLALLLGAAQVADLKDGTIHEDGE